MILVDTSVWVDHLRGGDPELTRLLHSGRVVGHPWVLGELALGQLVQRSTVLGLLQGLPQGTVATADEVLTLIDRLQLGGTGLGYVDVHLLASTRLSPGTRLWTRDRRLAAAALQAGCGVDP